MKRRVVVDHHATAVLVALLGGIRFLATLVSVELSFACIVGPLDLVNVSDDNFISASTRQDIAVVKRRLCFSNSAGGRRPVLASMIRQKHP